MTEVPPATFPSGIPLPSPDLTGAAAQVIMLTGMSGAGRTKAAAVLADLGWYVVDNLPPQLLEGLVAMVGRGGYAKVAVVVDVRGGDFFNDVDVALDHLEGRGVAVRLVFLDASNEALVRRFEEARRPHPLQGAGTLVEAIGRERSLLASIRERAAEVVDTSLLNVHQLRDVMTDIVGEQDRPLLVNVQSFGFKNGSPHDADYVADVRFLHNPHWVPALRALTGLDTPVRDYVLSSDGAADFITGYADVMSLVLERYRAHDKHSVTIAVGCTGGKHRSVAMAEELGSVLRDRGFQVRVTHRDRALQ